MSKAQFLDLIDPLELDDVTDITMFNGMTVTEGSDADRTEFFSVSQALEIA